MLFKGWGIYVSCFQLQSDPDIESIWKNAASMGHWKPFWHWATWLSSLGSLFGAGWTENSYGVSLHQGLSCHFMLLLVCLHLFKDALRQGDSTIFPGNLGNIFRSCMGLSLSSTWFTPYFHHLKPPWKAPWALSPDSVGRSPPVHREEKAPGCTVRYLCM